MTITIGYDFGSNHGKALQVVAGYIIVAALKQREGEYCSVLQQTNPAIAIYNL